MKLQEKINEDIKDAMRNSLHTDLAVLRQLKNAFTNAAITKGNVATPLDDTEALAIVRKQIAQREDSIEAFKKADRNELAAREWCEIQLLKLYLPVAISEDMVCAMIDAAISELGATTKRDMGKVIKRVVELANGATDNKTISILVGKKLQ
jgi:uncharacterized protein YqeY